MRNWFNKDIKKVLWNHRIPLLVIGVIGGFFSYIFAQLMVVKPSGLYIGQANAWGDWAVHITLVNSFANKPFSEWFLYHPFFAYGKLTYGFLIHAFTALLIKLGFSLPESFYITSFLLLFFLLIGLYILYLQLTHSKQQSILAIIFFFTSSGMGIFKYWQQLNWNKILSPSQDYSRYVEYEWLAGNIPAAMLIPQRAFFIGITIGIWVLNFLLWGLHIHPKDTIKKTRNKQKENLFFAGILAGVLPIAHMHSFITIVIVTSVICWCNRAKFQLLILYYVLPATLLSSILYLKFVYGGIEIDNFMTISIGWTVPKATSIFHTVQNWLYMWLNLWGTFLPTAIFALFLFLKKFSQKKELAFYLGFFVVFILANIIIFQPTKWDNTKLFAWVYMGLSPLVAQLILKLWQTSSVQRALASILILTLSATGFVEILRIANVSENTHLLSTTSEIIFAHSIAKQTATDAVFLTATAHNHPIPLWANRPIFLGYLGWIKNFGFDHTIRDQQLKQVFLGETQANQIIAENKISYIFVGPKEKATLAINQTYLKQFPIAFQNEDTIVYDTRQLWQ